MSPARPTAIHKVVAAPDKFKGTLGAAEAATAIGHACWELGIDCVELPMADGGDGLLEALGGANRESVVTGPLGDPVRAPWRYSRGVAVIEMARASGLVLAGGAERNDPITATTTGTGELIDRALDAGAERIIVGLGGSATTDGGFGAIRAIPGIPRLSRVELLVACDVTTRFTEAAEVFGPQKGATPTQVRLLTNRLTRLADMYAEEFGREVTGLPGSGAAGGLGGALAAVGGRLVPGVELVADELDLFEHLEDADLVITGEGTLDATSFAGKVVGGVLDIARAEGVPVAAVVGDVASGFSPPADLEVVSLVERFGRDRALGQPKSCVEELTRALLDPGRREAPVGGT